MRSNPVLSVVHPETPALMRAGAAEARIESARSGRRMDDRLAARRLAETSALLIGPRVFRGCRCGCKATLMPAFDGIYASQECEDKDRTARGLKVKSKGRIKDTPQDLSPSIVPRYLRKGGSAEEYPPAKSRSQVRWAKRALEEIEAGRPVETQMCVAEIKALAATPEEGLPWRAADLRAYGKVRGA